jgi:hypothetical protein
MSLISNARKTLRRVPLTSVHTNAYDQGLALGSDGDERLSESASSVLDWKSLKPPSLLSFVRQHAKSTHPEEEMVPHQDLPGVKPLELASEKALAAEETALEKELDEECDSLLRKLQKRMLEALPPADCAAAATRSKSAGDTFIS